MNHDIQTLLDQYWDWLKDRTILHKVEDWYEITTPHLDRHNDYIQIYVRKSGDGFLLTDHGYILDDLEMSGCPINTPRRQEILATTLRGFGVELVANNRLEVKAGPANFAVRKHNLLQAMLAVNDLFYLAQSTVVSLFREDVAAWLDDCDIHYKSAVTLTGKSGYDHRFNIIIPKSHTQPDRLLRTVNRPGPKIAQEVAFSCIDIREMYPSPLAAYAVLNDSERPVSRDVEEALMNYDVYPVPWTKRESVRKELAA